MKNILFIAAFLAAVNPSIARDSGSLNLNDQSGQFQITMVDPVRIIEVGSNHYLVDFGKDAFGTLVIKTTSGQSNPIIVHLGEKLSHPTSVDRDPGGTIRYQKVKLPGLQRDQAITLSLPPDSRNTNERAIALPDSFGVIMPFRYCELENLEIPINDLSIHQKVYHIRFNEQASSFSSSDTLLNQIWDLCKYSMKATSFAGVYVDGDRERIPYEADAFINQLGHYCVDSEYSMARRTNEYFMKNPTWPTEWILHTVLLFYYDFLYTGDLTSISSYYDDLKLKTLLDLAREDGLISSKSEKLTDEFMGKLGFKDTGQRIRDIVDWPPSQSDTGWKLATEEGERDGYEMTSINTVVNAFHFINLKIMAELAGHLGKTADSLQFHKRSVLVKKSINKKLMDREKGIYVDGESSSHSSLHANMFPLAFGLVPEKQVGSVVAFIKSRGMACSVYGSQFLLDGLYEYGEAEYALSLMTSTHDRSWWNMIRTGSTIAMEAWDMKYKPNADWNHAWGAAPANIVTRQLWGIKPRVPGFSKAQIRPQLGGLTWSNIKVPTIKGAIMAEYKLSGKGHKIFTIELPPGMTADFVLPEGETTEIVVNNERVRIDGKSLTLESGLTRIELRTLPE